MKAFRRGDTFSYIGPVRQSVGGVLSAFDLTGWTAAASLERQGTPTSLPLTATITDAANGVVRVSQTAANTAAWGLGQYDFKLRLTSPAGHVVSGDGGQVFKVVP